MRGVDAGCVEVEARTSRPSGMGGCVWVPLAREGRVKDEGGNKTTLRSGPRAWAVFVSDGMKRFCTGFDAGSVGPCCLSLNAAFEESEKMYDCSFRQGSQRIFP